MGLCNVQDVQAVINIIMCNWLTYIHYRELSELETLVSMLHLQPLLTDDNQLHSANQVYIHVPCSKKNQAPKTLDGNNFVKS